MILFGGHGEGQRKSHSIAWNNFCQPKEVGDWDSVILHHLNMALVMKLGWGTIGSLDALWIQVLRHKYGYGNNRIPVVYRKNNGS